MCVMLNRSLLHRLAVVGLAAAFVWPAWVPLRAQDASPPSTEAPVPAALVPSRLPPPSRTRHELALPGRTLRFTATAGAIEVSQGGQPAGEAGYVAYMLDADRPSDRPVTFAFNGGPGAASAWLHVGAMGPWRLPLTPGSGTALAVLPNAETWLDFTDLVFIDPPGTGYSRTYPRPSGQDQPPARQGRGRGAGGDPARSLWSVAGDIAALADLIEAWLRDNDRTASPRMLVGESYGGFRAPRIAALMQRRKLVFDALILVSPVVDFEGRRSTAGPGLFVHVLPSIVATQMERAGGQPTRAGLAAVENYARTDFLVDLMRGPRDTAAQARLVAHVTDLTKLPEATVREFGGRVSGFAYAREAFRAEQRYASVYDASHTAPDPGRDSQRGDPFLGGISQPLSRAVVQLYRERLAWNVDRAYELQSGEVLRGWQWPNSPNAPESVAALTAVLRDARTRLLVVHGYSDLVTPYFASVLHLDQLPYSGDEARVQLKVYPGGHMFYSRDASRSDFRADARQLWGDRTTMPAP